MYKNKKIGIVILNYKDAETTINLCKNISDYSVMDKIVVVDNLSPDDSFDVLKKLQNPKIDVIQSNKNGGYSYGNNCGAFYLIEKYGIDLLFIANPDVYFEENFIKVTADNLIDGEVEAVTGIMLDKTGKEYEFNGIINSYADDLLDCTVVIKKLLKAIKGKKKKQAQADKLYFCELLPGSLFGITSKAFKEINGFDENVFLYCEERILGFKLLQLKYKLAINKTVEFKHLHSVSINKSIIKINQVKHLYKSRLYFNKKYRNINLLQRILMKTFMAYGIFIRKIIYKIIY